jgi:hypothetical protein
MDETLYWQDFTLRLSRKILGPNVKCQIEWSLNRVWISINCFWEPCNLEANLELQDYLVLDLAAGSVGAFFRAFGFIYW